MPKTPTIPIDDPTANANRDTLARLLETLVKELDNDAIESVAIAFVRTGGEDGGVIVWQSATSDAGALNASVRQLEEAVKEDQIDVDTSGTVN